MYFLYLIIIFLGILVCAFFLTRTVLIMVSFFYKSPFVPLDKVLMQKALALLKVSAKDKFLDIGCGDGRVVFKCFQDYPGAKRYKGIDIMTMLVAFAKIRKIFFGKNSKIVFEKADAMKYSYKGYNKVFMYLLTDFVAELMPKLEKELPSKAVVVSVIFPIPEIYKKTGNLSISEVESGNRTKKLYMWEKN